jgi:16S rRNA (cytosine1402-N4)-methyltransferase
VLVAEAVSLLQPREGGVYVDCTLGLGGHARALFAAGAGRVIGIDRDPAAVAQSRAQLADFGERLEVVHADYREITSILHARRVTGVDGVIADLGVSSLQLDSAERGFSFKHDGPLDMRMDTSTGPTAAERLATIDEAALADVIYELGEERQSRRIARAIVRARETEPLTRTAQLASVVRRAAGGRGWQRIDPATRTFQALRIWMNQELAGLDAFLIAAVSLLRPAGRLVVIAFHSLEDRIVKHTFRRLADRTDGDAVVVLLTRKPVGPGEAELNRNPRSRSARLRAVEKLI